MNAYIITGGDVLLENIKIDLEEGDIVIAADSGFETAKKLKLPVDVIVGDMDSIKIDLPRGIETIKLPTEKDVTDTEAAVELAIERGETDVAREYLETALDGNYSSLATTSREQAQELLNSLS